LTSIVNRTGSILSVGIDVYGAKEIARRSRGTPRVANRLLKRVRDFAEVRGNGMIDQETANKALLLLEVDDSGFDLMDRKLLITLINTFDGGPAGIDSLAASIGEEKHTLEDVVEPYLVQQGFIKRTPRGRVATDKAIEHFAKLNKS